MGTRKLLEQRRDVLVGDDLSDVQHRGTSGGCTIGRPTLARQDGIATKEMDTTATRSYLQAEGKKNRPGVNYYDI